MSKYSKLTVADIEAGYKSDDWAGFGYLGGRRNASDDHTIVKADALLLDYANGGSWNAERLFDFTNSKEGRWFADATFGSFASEGVDDLARIYRDTDAIIGGYLTRIGREMMN